MGFSKIIRAMLESDADLARKIASDQGWVTNTFLPRLSNAANHSKLWLAVSVASAALGGRKGRRAAQRGMMSLGIASAIANVLLKPLFPRPRPPVNPAALPSIVRRPISSSFPSGHSASAAAYATATAMEAPAIAAPVAALAAGVAYSRVSTGVHYPSDVVFGSAIGAAVAVGTTKIWPRIDPTPAAAPRAPARFIAEPSPTGDGLVVVVNASSGGSSHESDLEVITEAFPDAVIVEVEDPTHLKDKFASAAAHALSLGVLGGDGTIGAAASAARKAGIPLAVFPGGTLNHFARDLGVDSMEDAVSAVQRGQLVKVDIAEIDGHAFLNTASFGSYSEFVETRERHEDRFGKWPAVAVALARVLFSRQPFEAELNGARRKIWMIFIGNCAYDPPGFAPAKRSRLDDRKLDVRIVDGTDPHAHLRLIAAVLTGRLGRSKVYTRELVEELTIKTPASSTLLAADGETFDGSGAFRVTKCDTPLLTYAPHR